MHWLSHIMGLDNLSGVFYGFWSGIGSDLQETAIFAGVIAILRHHNCHAKGCLRLGKLGVDGTPYVVCHKHHPTHEGSKAATADQIKQSWRVGLLGR